MFRESYSLSVISQHPEFKGKSLKKYNVNGLETIGVWGNEPFEIVFTNNTWQRVQVKLSIDGTDILTGKPADTSGAGDMWSVSGYGTLRLKAWPETNKGGAQFIFTSAEKSVAVNTHGDLSSRGIIAAAVYVEGYQPIRINNDYDIYKCSASSSTRGGVFGSNYSSGGWGGTLGGCTLGGTSFNSSDSLDDVVASSSLESFDANANISLQKLAAVGAGQHVEQNIATVAGLTRPVLSTVSKVRYLWWDDLVNELRTAGIQPSVGSGFPGDERRIMSLGSTPRQDNWTPPPFVAPSYSRF